MKNNPKPEGKFTEGPWTISEPIYFNEKHGRIVELNVCTPSRQHIATIRKVIKFEAMVRANAALIAAAPDMYEALMCVDAELDEVVRIAKEDYPVLSANIKKLIVKVRGALSKATKP